jgi:hypothetical protein
MSGAEAAAGISLLCNIIQIVTFVRDAITTYKSIEDSNTPDPRLAQMCEAVRGPYERIINEVADRRPLGQEQQALVDAAQKCVDRTEELNRVVFRLTVPENSRRLRKAMMTIGRSIKSMWHKKELEALEKDLERYQGLVDTQLLRHISGQARSSEQQHLRSFAELDDQLKQVLESYRTENLTVQQFILTESQRMKAHVTKTGADITRQVATAELGIRSDIHTLENNRLVERIRAEQKQRHKCLLESLHFPERNARWNRIEENYPKTFEWIFSSPREHAGYDSEEDESDADKSDCSTSVTFVPWLQSNSKMFWISGKPASGKSTLMKYILTNTKTTEHLQKWNPDISLIHHFFWKPGVTMQNSVDGMLCSLLYQILEHQPSLVEFVSEGGFDPAEKKSHHDWSPKELRSTLFRLLKAADIHFCIFLDGLDEAVEHLHKFEIRSLLDRLVQLDCVKICASGRPEPKFDMYFTGTEQLAIHDLTRKDIKRLVKKRLKDMEIDPDFRRNLASIVVRRAQGVFMWVILVLNSVHMGIESETPEACLERVSRMAQDLYSLYMEMWTRATHHGIDRTIAIVYFDLIIRRSVVFEGTILNRVTVLDLAMMTEEEGIMTGFFEDVDTLSAGKLLQQVEKTKKRIKFGCAGLLECGRGSHYHIKPIHLLPESRLDPKTIQSLSDKVCEWANITVGFTHRTVFDFFTDSEFGRGILENYPTLKGAEFLSRSIKSIMFTCGYLKKITTIGSVYDGRNYSSTIISVIKCIYHYESRNPEVMETTDKVVKTVWKCFQKGHCNDSEWKSNCVEQFSLLKEPGKVRLLEFVEALMTFYPRVANNFIQGLQDSDFFDALPLILSSGCAEMPREGKIERLRVVRLTLSRLDELSHAGKSASQEYLSRITRLGFSHFLRQILRGVCNSHPQESLLDPQHRGIVRSIVETIESFTKLEVFHHDWNQSFIATVSFDFKKCSVLWQVSQVSPLAQSIMVNCNDFFVKNYLAGLEGLQDLYVLGQNTDCKPALDVLLVCIDSNSSRFATWMKPQALDAEKIKDLLFQIFVRRQSFLLVRNQLEELFSSIECEDWAYIDDVDTHPWSPVRLAVQ